MVGESALGVGTPPPWAVSGGVGLEGLRLRLTATAYAGGETLDWSAAGVTARLVARRGSSPLSAGQNSKQRVGPWRKETNHRQRNGVSGSDGRTAA